MNFHGGEQKREVWAKPDVIVNFRVFAHDFFCLLILSCGILGLDFVRIKSYSIDFPWDEHAEDQHGILVLNLLKSAI